MPPELHIADVLRRHGVPFVIIGGHAVVFHGYRRSTEDTDVVWLRSAESEQALLNALTELGAQYIGDHIDPTTKIERAYPVNLPYIQASHLMMLTTRHGFLDLFDYIPGFPTEPPSELLASGVELQNVRFASLDWLRRMKRASGRAKDLLDLENLPE